MPVNAKCVPLPRMGEKCGARLILSPAPKESLWSLLSGGILILLAVLQLLDKK